MHPAVLYAFAAMVVYALFMLLTRYMAPFDPPLVTLFYSMFVGTFGGAPFAYADWVTPPDTLSWVLLASLGILGGIGHWLFLHAYRLAPASAIAPFLYMQLLTMVSVRLRRFRRSARHVDARRRQHHRRRPASISCIASA